MHTTLSAVIVSLSAVTLTMLPPATAHAGPPLAGGISEQVRQELPASGPASVGPDAWTPWENLGGSIFSAPAVASWESGRLDVFAINVSGRVIHRWYGGGSWSGWEDLGGGSHLEAVCCNAAPAAVSWGPGRIDLFVRGTDQMLWHRAYNNGSWSLWESLGGAIFSAPAVSSWAPGRLDVFATNMGGELIHKSYSGGAWSIWEKLGGGLPDSVRSFDMGGSFTRAAPTAVSWEPGRIDVFIRDAESRLRHMWFNGVWSSWADLGGWIFSPPAVSSWGSGRLDVFATGGFGEVVHKWYSGGRWSAGWESQGGASYHRDACCDEAPAAVSWDTNRIDVFVRGRVTGFNAPLYHKWWR